MDRIAVSTVVYLPPDDVYEFLLDFPRYGEYSEYLAEVRQRGDGSPGTQYALTVEWWKLTYTLPTVVTDVENPSRIDWQITDDIDGRGRWRIEELDDLPEEAPDDADQACRVALLAEFDADSARSGAIGLPRFVSLDWVLERVKPLAMEEAERTVERIVADLEGRRREVDLRVHERPGSG